jgi:hypothetical protein
VTDTEDNLFAGVAWALLLVTLLLVGLKACGLIPFSWWLLLSPLWVPIGAFGSLVLLLAFAYLIAFGGGNGH